MHFKTKNLPKRWSYGLTPRLAKQWLRDLDADVRSVEFLGTDPPLSVGEDTLLYMASLTGRVVDDGWRYRLCFWGAPVGELPEDLQDIRTGLTEGLQVIVDLRREQPVDATMPPFRVALNVRHVGDAWRVEITSKPVDSFAESAEQARQWWLYPASSGD